MLLQRLLDELVGEVEVDGDILFNLVLEFDPLVFLDTKGLDFLLDLTLLVTLLAQDWEHRTYLEPVHDYLLVWPDAAQK